MRVFEEAWLFGCRFLKKLSCLVVGLVELLWGRWICNRMESIASVHLACKLEGWKIARAF